jgi:predicted TIM-barrel fold metal-dependent hydrolase
MNDTVFRSIEQQFAEALAKRPAKPNRTMAQLKASAVVAAMEEFALEVELVYGQTGIGEMEAARERLPDVRDMLTHIANQLGDALGAREQLVAYAGQMVDAIDWDLRERIQEERTNEHQYRREA